LDERVSNNIWIIDRGRNKSKAVYYYYHNDGFHHPQKPLIRHLFPHDDSLWVGAINGLYGEIFPFMDVFHRIVFLRG
jgi:hypothetical protein